MRWMENRVLVSSTGDQLQVLDALRIGRSYGLFSLFGEPNRFSFTAEAAGGGTSLQMGDTAQGSLTLKTQLPDRPQAMGLGGATFSPSEGDTAEISAKFKRVDATGTTEVYVETSLGVTVTLPVTQPGAYYVEIWIKPKHLTAALGSASVLADKEYLWLISNPIHLTP
jgi:hypothetical protein